MTLSYTKRKRNSKSSANKRKSPAPTPSPPFSLYGKLCNVNNRDDGESIASGVCFACRGKKDSVYKTDHPVLLCDGNG